MDRNQGLRRTTAITGVLVAASLAGTLAVGIAARADDAATPTSDSGSTATDPAESGSGSTATDPAESGSGSSGTTTDSPTLSSGGDGSGQATSGGS